MGKIPNNIYVNDNGMVMDIYSKMFEDRIIFLITDINSETANLVKSQLLYLDSISHDPIKMYIDSNGGEVYTCMGVIDTMNFIKSTVITVNIGICASMAAIVLSNGDVRRSLPNSRVLMHQPMGGRVGQSTDIEIASRELSHVKKILYKIMADKTNKSVKDIEKDVDRDKWMSSKQALKYGIIDEIVDTNTKKDLIKI